MQSTHSSRQTQDADEQHLKTLGLQKQVNARSPRKHRWKWLRSICLFLLSLWSVLILWQAPVIKRTVIADELRGIWLTNYGAAFTYYTTRLDEAMADMARHHLNTVYPAVWNRGYTLHSSQVAKQAGGTNRNRLTSLPFLPFQNTLAELVHQGHRQQLRVIPWFEYGLLIPKSSAIARAHPDWLTMKQTEHSNITPPAETLPARLLRWLSNKIPKAAIGEYEAYLNPCHPEVQEFLTDLIVEVVQQ